MQNSDAKMLDQIIKRTISAIENSKTQIFDIYEAAQKEMDHVALDVERVKRNTVDMITKVDELEKRERQARIRLMEVSRNFTKYSEADIRQAYEEANQLQIELAVTRAKEEALRRQRTELELRLKKLKETVDKAEHLVSQVGVVMGYLGNEMGNVVNKIETLQQQQIFGGKIIKAQEEERRRVSREIHDGPAQAMANVVFRAEVCERLIDNDIERAKVELRELRGQVRSCLQETRKIIFDLRPMAIDDLGLVSTLRKLMESAKEQSGLITEVRVLGDEKRLNSYIEIGLFRIVQEALSNVQKHSNATMVIILLEYSFKFVSVVVEDNGKGFDVSNDIGQESFGLMGMRERAKILNGDIHIKSEPNAGTKITVRIPIR